MDQAYVQQVTLAAQQSSADIDCLVWEQLIAELRRSKREDDQAFSLSELLELAHSVALNEWAKTYLAEWTRTMEHLARDLRQKRIEDEAEHARSMSTVHGRKHDD